VSDPKDPKDQDSTDGSMAAGADHSSPVTSSADSSAPAASASREAPPPAISDRPLLDLIELEPEPELEQALEQSPKQAPPASVKPTASAPTGARSTADAASAGTVTSKRPFVRGTRVEWPLAIAGSCAALFVAACLAGQQGIFPHAATVEIAYSERLLVLLRGLLMMLLSGGCLVAGAAIVQLVERGPLGDLQALSARMLMISAASILVRAVPVPIAFLKQTHDVLAPLAVAWLLVLLVFRLSPRDAGMVIGAAILSLLVLAFGSTIVSFAIWAGSTAASAPTP
jgi:hypothetical protein